MVNIVSTMYYTQKDIASTFFFISSWIARGRRIYPIPDFEIWLNPSGNVMLYAMLFGYFRRYSATSVGVFTASLKDAAV